MEWGLGLGFGQVLHKNRSAPSVGAGLSFHLQQFCCGLEFAEEIMAVTSCPKQHASPESRTAEILGPW